MTTKEILILGCGVSSLSSGILLLKSGYQVTIWAKDLPPNTTSNKAAAFWYPYLCFPRDKAIPWARATFEYLQQHILQDQQSGCILKTVTELFDKPQSDPWWKAAFPGKIDRPTKADLPAGYVDGYRIQSIVIDTSLYMDYLVQMFKKLGGTIIQREVKDIKEALLSNAVVVNCTGLGARELFRDDKVYPVRGQMVKIKANGFDQVVVDDEGPNSLCLAVSRVNDLMLGGTIQANNWNTEVDPHDTQEILHKVRQMNPNFPEIKVISESVGLRPAREAVRLETEKFGENTVIHNYGHGGAGFTLSWGCAQDVVGLVKELISVI